MESYSGVATHQLFCLCKFFLCLQQQLLQFVAATLRLLLLGGGQLYNTADSCTTQQTAVQHSRQMYNTADSCATQETFCTTQQTFVQQNLALLPANNYHSG